MSDETRGKGLYTPGCHLHLKKLSPLDHIPSTTFKSLILVGFMVATDQQSSANFCFPASFIQSPCFCDVESPVPKTPHHCECSWLLAYCAGSMIPLLVRNLPSACSVLSMVRPHKQQVSRWNAGK
ncbi:hypothetical protein INR49_026826 [Caranx melampygus]|nr:hypothetical protein INR49_026826 [Caranx melampygus]